MEIIRKITLSLILFFCIEQNLFADATYFIDFKYILNQSDAGKKAQDQLKKKLENGINNLEKNRKNLQDDEKKLIQQKKIVSPEEYKKKVTELRNKVNNLTKERNSLLEKVASQRTKARSELLKNLNPIVASFMEEKNIKMIIDKKSVLLADESLDVTKEIIKILNSKLKSIKLN
jgi:Skp family chaperone for outer membrane proteins